MDTFILVTTAPTFEMLKKERICFPESISGGCSQKQTGSRKRYIHVKIPTVSILLNILDNNQCQVAVVRRWFITPDLNACNLASKNKAPNTSFSSDVRFKRNQSGRSPKIFIG